MASEQAIFDLSNARLADVVRRLVEAYSPEQIYVFGSMARGDTGPNSDFDLMVIVSDNAPPERQRSRLAYQALRGTGTAADVVVWPKSSFERRTRVPASRGGLGGAGRGGAARRISRRRLGATSPPL